MPKYVIYGTPVCSYCEAAKSLLESKGLEYSYTDITQDEGAKELILGMGLTTVPQIWKDGNHMGGFVELHKALIGDNNGESNEP